MKRITTTVLFADENKAEEVLRFCFPDGSAIDVSLTGLEGNSQLKTVFEAVLALQMEDEVSVDFVATEGYSNNMYIQVCKAYTQSLQRELDQVRAAIEAKDF